MSRRSRWLCLLLCLALLPVAAFMPAALAADEPAPTVRVHLKRLALTDRADLTLSGIYTASTGTGAALAFPRDSEITVQVRDGQLYLFYQGLSLAAGSVLRLTQHQSPTLSGDGIRFRYNANFYPGNLSLTVADGLLQPVLTLSVEDYLMGVVPYEMSNSFPLEALKAQAICARTYALSHIDSKAAWDLVDTTNDQVFRGVDLTQQNAIRAVRETAGIVGMYGGKLATCYYSASNGGQTELVQNVWSGRGDWSYYQMTDDPYDLENPESIVRRATLSKKAERLPEAFSTVLCNYIAVTMGRLGYEPDPAHFRVDSLLSMSLSGDRFDPPSRFCDQLTVGFTWSGRKPIYAEIGDEQGDYGLGEVVRHAGVAAATPAAYVVEDALLEDEPALSDFIPAPGEYEVTVPLFPELIRALNLSISGSGNEMVTLTETEQGFVLESRRYGHGVGMSQRGAQWMAAKYGKRFTEILAFYYPGMKLAKAPSGARQPSTAAPNLVNTPGPAATPTPRPTLMPVTSPLPQGAYLASVELIEDDSSLNLRTEPTLAGDLIMRLYKHQLLAVLEVCEDPEWVHVRTDSVEGYVKVSFLERVEAPSPTPTAAR